MKWARELVVEKKKSSWLCVVGFLSRGLRHNHRIAFHQPLPIEESLVACGWADKYPVLHKCTRSVLFFILWSWG